MSSALLAIIQLFDAGTRHLKQASLASRALLVAQSHLERIRAWASIPGNFANLSGYPGQNVFTSEPDGSGLESRIQLAYYQTYSPDWGSELLASPTQRRVLQQSHLKLEVETRWGSRASETVQLASMLAAPNRGWHASTPLVVTLTPNTPNLNRDETRQLQVAAFDSNNQPLNDLKYSWTVVAVMSDGHLQSQSRDGKEAVYIHQIPTPTGIRHGPPGEVWVEVSASYWGQMRRARVVLSQT